MTYAAIPALALWLAADLGSASAGLDLGYMQMYDLQFTAAHKTFADYAQAHPEDPLAPVSDAAAYLFAEFDRLKILQSEFFVHDENFRRPKKLNSDPAVRRAFDADLVKSDKLARRIQQSEQLAAGKAKHLIRRILDGGRVVGADGAPGGRRLTGPRPRPSHADGTTSHAIEQESVRFSRNSRDLRRDTSAGADRALRS